MKIVSRFNSGYILLISCISALGGYLFGFDFAVISGALPFLKHQFNLNAYWEGFTTGCLALGCMIGCIVAGRLADRFGRKPALMTAAMVFSVSSLAMAFSPGLTFFITARFIAGIGVGMASVLSPLYIAEIAPANMRGRMVSIYQLTIVVGILITNLVNYSLRNHGDTAWRWMFGLGTIPSALFFLSVFILPESPSWLLKRGNPDKARQILEKIGGSAYVTEALGSMNSTVNGGRKPAFSDLFKMPFFPLVVTGVALAVFQQFCGINVVFNYTAVIFESIGFGKDDQLLQTVFIGAINLLFTFLAMSLVDRWGRKPLMVAGAIGLAVLYVAIAETLSTKSGWSPVFLLAAIGLYASSLAPVTWVMISEIFPGKVRAIATSFAVLCLWAAYFILTFTFPILVSLTGSIADTFYIYAGICVIGGFFIGFFVKETKGIALGETDAAFIH